MTPRSRTLLAVLACATGLGGCVGFQRDRPGMGPGHEVVNQSVISLTSFGPEEFPSLAPSLRDACAAMIFPRVSGGTFGVGVAHGRGVLMVRDAARPVWHGPVFLSISEIDAGLQVAMGSREFVVVLHSCARLAPLYDQAASLHAGALLADQAGEHGSMREVGKDVQVYSRMHGVDVGAALNGTMLRIDLGLAEEFYGSPLSVKQILALDAEADPIAIELRRAMAFVSR